MKSLLTDEEIAVQSVNLTSLRLVPPDMHSSTLTVRRPRAIASRSCCREWSKPIEQYVAVAPSQTHSHRRRRTLTPPFCAKWGSWGYLGRR